MHPETSGPTKLILADFIAFINAFLCSVFLNSSGMPFPPLAQREGIILAKDHIKLRQQNNKRNLKLIFDFKNKFKTIKTKNGSKAIK